MYLKEQLKYTPAALRTSVICSIPLEDTKLGEIVIGQMCIFPDWEPYLAFKWHPILSNVLKLNVLNITLQSLQPCKICHSKNRMFKRAPKYYSETCQNFSCLREVWQFLKVNPSCLVWRIYFQKPTNLWNGIIWRETEHSGVPQVNKFYSSLLFLLLLLH